MNDLIMLWRLRILCRDPGPRCSNQFSARWPTRSEFEGIGVFQLAECQNKQPASDQRDLLGKKRIKGRSAADFSTRFGIESAARHAHSLR